MKVKHNDIIFTKKEYNTLKEASEILHDIAGLLYDDKDLADGYCYTDGDVWGAADLIDDVIWYANKED